MYSDDKNWYYSKTTIYLLFVELFPNSEITIKVFLWFGKEKEDILI